MPELTFLEDVGNPYSISPIGDAKLWQVRHLRNDPNTPPLIYVMESEVAQQFLLGREISGRSKFNLIRSIFKSFVQLSFEQLNRKDLYQYLILRGAYPCDLQYAIGCFPPYDQQLLHTGFIKLQRILNQEGTDWEVQSQNLIGEYRGDTWLIPDAAIASGSTIASFLRNGFTKHLPKQIYIYTACGSLEGLQRIYRECQKKGVELIPILSQCILEISKTGNLPGHPLTDLSLMSPGSITTKAFYEKAFHRYQGTGMCSIGDIGDSLKDPLRYSLHTLWEMEILKMDPKKEDWGAWTFDIRGKRFQKKVLDFNPVLFDYFKEIWRDGD
jgi:hypothetical protein